MNRDSLLGIPFNKNIYESKWAYFKEMDFMRSYKRRSNVVENYDDSTNSNGDEYGVPQNISKDTTQLHTSINIKMEPQDDMDNSFEHQEFMLNDSEISNDMMFEEFESIQGSDSVEEESNIENFKEEYTNPSSEDKVNIKHEFVSTDETENVPKLSSILNALERPNETPSLEENSNKKSCLLAPNKVDCSCLKRSARHVQFQEDFLKKKQKLITTTDNEPTDSCYLQHIGDSDYNFLISFLPQIKKMTALQKLQFRANMSAIVLNTLAP